MSIARIKTVQIMIVLNRYFNQFVTVRKLVWDS